LNYKSVLFEPLI